MTDTLHSSPGNAVDLGAAWASAVADKDRDALLALLSPSVDFKGVTPGRCWETEAATELVDEIVLGRWFGNDQLDELEHVQSGSVATRNHVCYRLRITTPTGPAIVEQQVYYDVVDGQISWLRLLCSGKLPG